MDEPQKPLTDQEIRQELRKRKELTLQLGLDILTLQEALKAKGILNDEDLAQATLKVAQKGREDVARVVAAIQKKPPESLQ